MGRPARFSLRCVPFILLAVACASPEDSVPSVWFALDAPRVSTIRERSLVPIARLHPDGSWDLPWPRPRRVSGDFPAQASLIPVDRNGFLHAPPGDSSELPRPGVHWLLPYATADSARLRAVAPVRWHRYAAGEVLQAQLSVAEGIGYNDRWSCGFWLLRNSANYGDDAPPGLALSIPAQRPLREADIAGLDEALAKAGLPHQPADADGGYDHQGHHDLHTDSYPDAGRYPRRSLAALVRVRDGLDVALVAWVEAGPQFGARPVTTWALVELREGRAGIVSRFSGHAALCAGRPAENRTADLWLALATHDGSRLDPLGRRVADGSWHPSWPEGIPFVDMDRGGFLHHRRSRGDDPERPPDHWPLPFRSVDGERARLDLPLLWYRHLRRSTVPGTVTDLMLASRHCEVGWALRLDPDRPWRDASGRSIGVAFSDPSVTRLEEETPELERMRIRLGLIDRPTSREEGGYSKAGTWYPRREVIGYFRLGDATVLGVVQAYHYEGEGTVVFEIPAASMGGEGLSAASDTARIVLDVHGGGC